LQTLATHWRLGKNQAVSCEESDMQVTLALENTNIAMEAKQMVEGFGVFTFNIARKYTLAKYSEKDKEKYVATFKKEPDFYSVSLNEVVHLY